VDNRGLPIGEDSFPSFRPIELHHHGCIGSSRAMSWEMPGWQPGETGRLEDDRVAAVLFVTVGIVNKSI
jgi:hypothetical protein